MFLRMRGHEEPIGQLPIITDDDFFCAKTSSRRIALLQLVRDNPLLLNRQNRSDQRCRNGPGHQQGK